MRTPIEDLTDVSLIMTHYDHLLNFMINSLVMHFFIHNDDDDNDYHEDDDKTLACDKGLFTYYVSHRRGGGGMANADHC